MLLALVIVMTLGGARQVDAADPTLYEQATVIPTYQGATNDTWLADDFTVPGGSVWILSEAVIIGTVIDPDDPFGSNPNIPQPTSFTIDIHADNAGLPGTTLFSATGLSYTRSGSEYSIPLTGTPALQPGTYWLSVQAAITDETESGWLWQSHTPIRGNGAAGHLSEAYTTCQDWHTQGTCFGVLGDDLAFRVRGLTKTAQTITFGTPVASSFEYAPGLTFAVGATASSTLAVSFAATGPCTVAGGTVSVSGIGDCVITASQAGNGTYGPAPAVSRTFTITKIAQTITFTPATLTYAYAPSGTFTVTATASSGLAVGFALGSGTTSGACTLSGTTVTAGTAIATATITGVGDCVIVAAQAGDATHMMAQDVSRTFTIGKADQTLNFDLPTETGFTYAPGLTFTVGATASSGLTVSFTATGTCTVAGTTVTVSGSGDCTVTAAQPGNENYKAITSPPSRTFTISTAAQTIVFDALSDKTYGAAPIALSASGGDSGQPVTFTATPATVCVTGGTNGTTITIVGAGSCTVSADQAGSGNYAPATTVERSFTVDPAPLTLRAENQSRRFGEQNPAQCVVVLASPTSFVNGDELTDLSGTLACATTATNTSLPGDYPLTPSGLTSANYAITFVAGTLTVTPAPTTLTVAPASGTTGTTTTLTATLTTTGNQPVVGQSIAFTINGTAVCGTSLPACPQTDATGVATLAAVSLGGIAPGSYQTGISGTFAGGGGYTGSQNTAALTVAPTLVNLTVTVEGPGRVGPSGGSYPRGTTVDLTATPDSGALFLGWRSDDQLIGWNPQLTLSLDRPRQIVAAFATRPTFSDVQAGTRAHEVITQLAARDVINGYQEETCATRGLVAPCFGPADPVLRAQVAALIVRAFGWGQPIISGPLPFSDIGSVDPELQRAITILAGKGILKGYGDGTYNPTDDVLQIQIISIITRAMVSAGYWTPATVDEPTIYPNVDVQPADRLDLVTFVQHAGPLPDFPTNGNWANWSVAATRSWAALVLWQALDSHFGVNRLP